MEVDNFPVTFILKKPSILIRTFNYIFISVFYLTLKGVVRYVSEIMYFRYTH